MTSIVSKIKAMYSSEAQAIKNSLLLAGIDDPVYIVYASMVDRDAVGSIHVGSFDEIGLGRIGKTLVRWKVAEVL